MALEDELAVDRTKAAIASVMDEFRKATGTRSLELDAIKATRAGNLLSERAWGFLNMVSRSRNDAMRFASELTSFLQPVFAAVREPEKPLIEIIASVDDPIAWLLPVELFPMTDGNPAAPLTYYLGFKAIIARTRERAWAPPAGTEPVPLRLFALRHPNIESEYPGIARQLKFFKTRSADFAIRSEWPSLPLSTDPTGDLAAQLLSALHVLPHEGVEQQILHFACHFRRGRAESAIDELDFGNDVRVPIVPLTGQMTIPSSRTNAAAANAILFLNACQTGAGGLDRRSLMWVMRKQGFTHIIGTEALLPDKVAAAFAVCFYQLFVQGNTLGESILEARRALLYRFENPFGILYSLYGDPDLRVRA